MAWEVKNVWTNSGIVGNDAEITAEKDGQTVYVTTGDSEDGRYYVVSGESLFSGKDVGGSIIAEYPSQKAALASEYGPLFRKAIAAFRKI